MKATNLLLSLAFFSGASGLLAQGTVNFYNRVFSTGSNAYASVIAPIFFNPADPDVELKQGNPTASWNGTNGPTPVPLGTQVYSGAPLHGTGFTVQLWAAGSQASDSAMAAIATNT